MIGPVYGCGWKPCGKENDDGGAVAAGRLTGRSRCAVVETEPVFDPIEVVRSCPRKGVAPVIAAAAPAAQKRGCREINFL